MCIITCNDGFKIIGPSEKRCMSHGTWNSKFEDTYCIDVVPPKLECPQNITTNTLFGKKYGQVHWQHPHVTDNSGLEVLVWVKPAMNNISDFKFQIGKTPVIYFARDAFHNTAKCRFFVLVEDNEMPLIENCVNPPPFLTGDSNGSNITWEEPYIYDNSQEVKVNKYEIKLTSI
ncbi:sushi, von Willebrand factor type A, EGF and pentraxin domain-containing protein 1-like [Anoplophora glabripennis]|uniref:sushi, von Willebrand factor type A, EGF and pentraxin domain-containing protein 1-like n=1 Tax=Anoplophora glabripennis TaxID=217634 RepID=UPI000873C74A|nr:sushi, von Willebrand factor type A, EGF and pentraxin domain-containing protein 1-like [Anoplophora glabripennis]